MGYDAPMTPLIAIFVLIATMIAVVSIANWLWRVMCAPALEDHRHPGREASRAPVAPAGIEKPLVLTIRLETEEPESQSEAGAEAPPANVVNLAAWRQQRDAKARRRA